MTPTQSPEASEKLPDAAPAGGRRGRWSSVGTTPPMIALAGIGLLATVVMCPLVRDEAMLVRSLLGVGGVMFAWLAFLWARSRARGDGLRVEFVPVRSHYVQGLVQIAILAYWGWYVRDVGAESPLIFAQVIYLTILDALISWSRGRSWRLGFGALPIVLSTNLLLWFHHDVYYLQFVMLTIGALGKQFITWERDGRRTHIFNPSVFGQSVVAAALIATGTSNELTRGQWIASTFEAPHHMILLIFLLGLGVQSLFGVTLMTLGAASMLWVLNLIYTEITGLYFFVTVNIAATIFLGLHLLITDPATTPRTNLGKLVFGAMYGLGYFVLFRILDLMEIPVFWDKLLPVPILNLLAPSLDRFARSGAIGRMNAWWQSALGAIWMNVVHMAAWVVIFAVMMATGFVGGDMKAHPGNSIPFWKGAYLRGEQHAAHSYVMVAGAQAEGMGRPEAFNELGVICMDGLGGVVKVSPARAAAYFVRGAAMGDVDACNNLAALHLYSDRVYAERDAVLRAMGVLHETCGEGGNALGCYLIGVAYETGGIGYPVDYSRAGVLYELARESDGGVAPFAVKGIARAALRGGLDYGGFVKRSLAALTTMADTGDGEACWYLAHLHYRGIGASEDLDRAKDYLRRACENGIEPACIGAEGGFSAYADPPAVARPGWASAFDAE